MGKSLRQHDPRRFRPLTGGTSVHEIADRSREAAISFVVGTAGGWSPGDLEAWLSAPYRLASCSFAVSPRSRATLSLVGGSFETSLMEAADLVRELLTSCANPRQPGFIQQVVDCGFVVAAQDANGALGYVPVDLAGMTLVDRVASLLAADFLTRPNDYQWVSICEDCGAVSFEWNTCEHEACADLRESGVIRRDDGTPVSYAAIFPPPEACDD